MYLHENVVVLVPAVFSFIFFKKSLSPNVPGRQTTLQSGRTFLECESIWYEIHSIHL